LFDVDNTLVDNDRIVADRKSNLERDIGNDQQQRYWNISSSCAPSSAMRTISARCRP
jgi:hypothetical protein